MLGVKVDGRPATACGTSTHLRGDPVGGTLYVLPNGNKPVYAAQAVYRVACLELGQWDRGSGAGRLARRQPKRYYPVKLDLAKEDRDRMCAVEESS